MKLTEYGFCLSDSQMTKETEADENDHLHGSEDDTTNNILDITLAYNVTDWTAGYFGEIGGYTVGCMWPISYMRNLQGSSCATIIFSSKIL